MNHRRFLEADFLLQSPTARRQLGPDTGFDSIGDWPQAASLSRYLDRDGRLPKTVLYNLNPADNYVFATMVENFQDGSAAGKIHFGSDWWILDQNHAGAAAYSGVPPLNP